VETSPRKNLLPAAILAGTLGLLGLALTTSREGLGASLARVSFDLLHVLQPTASFSRSNCPVVLVYLDLESHLRLRQSPSERWDRTLHTRLVERLTDAGARAIVFDVVFDTPWPQPAVDRDLAAAFRRHGRVILAAERHQSTQATGATAAYQVRGLNLPDPLLRQAAHAWGAAELAVDPDFVVRQSVPWLDQPDQPTLARAAALAIAAPHLPTPPSTPAPTWLRYYGPPLTLPHVSYRNALEPDAAPADFFRDRVVFVGSRPMVGAFGERRDELRHPYSSWNTEHTFMPGVEIHATQLLNWIRGDGLHRTAPPTEAALTLGAALALGTLLVRLRPIPGALAAATLAVASGALAQTAFAHAHVWYPWLIVAAVLAPAGWLAAAAHHTRDWRRQRRAFEARRRADARRLERQAMLIEHAQDLILVADLQGRVRYANPSARHLFTLPADSDSDSAAPAAPAGPALPTDPTPTPVVRVPDFAATRDRLRATGQWSGIIACGGEPDDPAARLLDSRWTLVRESDGEPDSILIIGTDITEKHRLEAEFLRAQKWEAIGSLAGGMAHDLNNVLAPALLGLQVLQRSETRDETRRTLAMIESHARRGAETVRQVLGFLRGHGLTFETLDPVALVRELESLVRATFPSNIRVSSLIAPRVGPIRGNATQLHQALLNLCLNARDAMPAGGELTFALDDVDLSPTEAAQWKDGRAGAFVLIAVSDSGAGIPPENLDRIFDPLFTTKEAGRGTGLGLSSVLRIVQQHQGFVGVASDLGAGSTFELYLPRNPAGPPDDNSRPVRHGGTGA
jgi:signal transduction histidine kinase/CHASE2 domain-containing sensor protein